MIGLQVKSARVVCKGDVGVVIIFKNASRSMVTTGTVVSAHRVRLPKHLHVFVRDPIQRLKSAYQFFHGRSRMKALTWEQFIDRVLAGDENVHWLPVTETLKRLNRDDVNVHLFENLATEYPLGKLEHRNQSEPVNVDTDYRASDIRRFYAGDYNLRTLAGA